MQITSSNFKNKILEPSRTFYAAARIGDVSLENTDIVSATLETIQNTEGYSIGNTISQSLELTFLNIEATIYTSNQLKMVLGLNTTGSTFENLVMGYFNIDEVEKNDFTTKYTCYDNMIKFETPYISQYGATLTLQQVVNDLVRITGVQYNNGLLPSYIVTKLEGYTCREVLGFLASICGGNAYIDRGGKFAIIRPQTVTYSITGDNYIDYKREETVYKIGKVTCYKDKDNYFSKGSLGTDSMELQFENPWITETILNDIYNKLNGFSYLGYAMKWQGDMSLDVGDIITCTDVKGVTRNLPILSRKLNFSGGLTSEIGAKGLSKNKNSFSSSGSTSNKVERMMVKQAVIEEALIGKANIQDLTAVDIRTQTLEVKTATIENIIVSKADIADLNATNATITNLVAEDVRINNLVANKAEITDLNATVGRVGVLESNTADIGTIRSNLATITTLVNGNITSENIQSLILTSDKVTVQNGFIKNAMIENLDVSKINAGNIDTNKFMVSSANGAMSIIGATQQFKDKFGNTRIQMGQDAQGNFSFIVKAEDGTTTLIDGYGIKEGAIANKLIKTNMVADNAIGEQQLNYSSLITGINKDTNTNFIKSSKVLLNSTNQSLEVAFNEMNSKVEGITTGATNLFKGTRDFNSNYWTGGAPLETYENDNTCKQATIVSTTSLNLTTQTAKQGFDFSDITKTWTISAMFKGTRDGQTIGLNLSAQRLAWQQQAVTNGEWKKLSWTFTGDGYTLTSFRFTNPSLVGSIKVAQVKVEEGAVATEWTIAPTDITSAIENILTQVNIQQGQIDTAIANTKIINSSGGEVLLKDDYNITKSTVNSNLSTIGTHTTQISNLQTTVNSQGSSITQLRDSITLKVDKSDYDSNKTAVSNNINAAKTEAINSAKTYTDSNVETLDTKINNANSSITILQNKITSKVEQSDIDTSIRNVTIGGRNLVRNSNFRNGLTNYRNSGADSLTVIEDSTFGYCSKIVTSTVAKGIYTTSMNIEKDYKYTLSVYLKADVGANLYIAFDGNGTNNASLISVTTEWKRYELTRVATGVNNFPRVYSGATGTTTFYVANLKLEKGSKATDWTIAPEDLDQQIADVSTSIDTKIATAKAEIKQTTDSIALNVSNLQSTTSTLTTQMANKVETSEFNTVKDTQAQLITDLTGITSRVSSVESVTTSNTTAIENTNANLDSLTTEYNTTKSTVATHETKITGITSRVTSTESNITTINGNITSLQTRVNSTEQQITPTAITTTISSAIGGGIGSISTTQFIMDKTGLTIKNGAIKVLNSNNAKVFGVNISGSLELVGDITTKNHSTGNKSVEILGNIINLYDWASGTTRTLPVGKLYSGRRDSNASTPCVVLANEEAAYLSLSFFARNINNYQSYIDFDMNGVIPETRPYTRTAPIMVNHNMDLYYSTLNFGRYTSLYQGTYSGDTGEAKILFMDIDSSVPGAGFRVRTRSGYRRYEINEGGTYLHRFYGDSLFNDNLTVSGSLTVTGAKACVEETDNYGEMLSIASESPQAWRFDNYMGKSDENGECLIYMDDVFIEIANTDMEYMVTIQERGEGVLRPVEFTKTWFRVQGTPNLSFSCKVEALRRKDELQRNTRKVNTENEKSDIEKQDTFKLIFDNEILENTEQTTKILENEIEFKLDDYLLGGM